jgi:hypothetical protein
MFREEYSGYAGSPRPPRKTRPWVPLVVLVVVGLAVAHVAGLTKPLTTLALQLTGLGSHTPGWRLVGDWQSDNDPMWRRVCHLAPKEGYRGTGIYRADAGRGMREVIFRITSEDRSGRHVEMAEFLPEVDANYQVRYSIADDGKSMTREYDTPNGTHVSCQYRYLGPPTEAPY